MNRRISLLLAASAILAACASPGLALDNSWMDRYHSSVEGELYDTVVWFDSFFSSEPRSDLDNTSAAMRLTNDFRWDEEQRFEYRIRVRARIRLPALKGKFRLTISGENQGDPNATEAEDPGNPGLSPRARDGRASTELAYDLYRTRGTILFAGVGVRVRIDPTAFARLRLVHARALGHSFVGRVAVTPYWDARDRFGETNEVEVERALGPETLARWNNSTNINENRSGMFWGTDLSVRRKLSAYSTVSVGAGATGSTRPAAVVENYRTYVRYRRNFLRSWLYYELEPDINWPRREGEGRKAVWGGTVRLEVDFTGRNIPDPP
jgi:hypothetical protein